MNVVEIHYNWSTDPEQGPSWLFYRVGDYYLRKDGDIRCESIKIKFDHGLHAVVTFADGTTEHQWNINKIIEAEFGKSDTK